MTHSPDFGQVGEQYHGYSGSARGRLRHDMVMRRIVQCRPRPGRALDVGCGDGEISLRLAAIGWEVVGFDPSTEMIERAQRRASAVGSRARFLTATLADWFRAGGAGDYDLVCCHGVLMYLPESGTPISQLAAHLGPNGHLSVLTKNAAAIGFREAMKRQYEVATELIRQAVPTSVGHLGLSTRGDTAATLLRLMRRSGMATLTWHGVRIFHDHDLGWNPSETDYEAALELEWAAAARSPYRDVAPLIHVVGRR